MKIRLPDSPLPRRFFIYCLLISLLSIGGWACLEGRQELILSQTGAGKLIADYVLGDKLTRTLEMTEALRETATGKATTEKELPINAKDMEELFRGEGVKVENSSFEKEAGRLHISYTVSFDNINHLLATKAMKGLEISFYRDTTSGNLRFFMGAQTWLRRVQQEPELLSGLKVDAILTLPSKVLETNADTSLGSSLTWHYDENKLKPEALTATCAGANLAFLEKLPTAARKIAAREYTYDSTGKPDPFKPFILEVSRPKETVKLLQPLQRYEISQLKLVGVIWAIKNPHAIIEDSAGKGYIVTIGTYVGKNGGQVSAILENELLITEKSTDFLGETKIKEIRMRLHTEERKVK